MRRIVIKIANVVIEIQANYYRTFKICQEFQTKEQPNIAVNCCSQDYEQEEEAYVKEFNSLAPSRVYLEVNSILRKISDQMIDYNCFLIHGAAIAIGNRAFLFSAPSGTGKTTHILKWMDNCPEAYIINGDKPFIRFFDDKTVPEICGSPWAGKENLYSNSIVPLNAIIFMERAEENSIYKITFSQAFPYLYQQVHRPYDSRQMIKTLQLIKRLEPEVSFYLFKFNNFKDNCFEIAYNTLVANIDI